MLSVAWQSWLKNTTAVLWLDSKLCPDSRVRIWAFTCVKGGMGNLGSCAFALPGLQGLQKWACLWFILQWNRPWVPSLLPITGICVPSGYNDKHVHRILLLWPHTHILLPLIRLTNKRVLTQQCTPVPFKSGGVWTECNQLSHLTLNTQPSSYWVGIISWNSVVFGQNVIM